MEESVKTRMRRGLPACGEWHAVGGGVHHAFLVCERHGGGITRDTGEWCGF